MECIVENRVIADIAVIAAIPHDIGKAKSYRGLTRICADLRKFTTEDADGAKETRRKLKLTAKVAEDAKEFKMECIVENRVIADIAVIAAIPHDIGKAKSYHG